MGYTVRVNWHGELHVIDTSAHTPSKAFSNAMKRLADKVGKPVGLVTSITKFSKDFTIRKNK